MTKKDLVKIIQEVVKREVKKEVKKIFIKEESSSNLKDVMPTDYVENEVHETESQKQYSKDETINKVLNETVGLSKQNEYPTLGGGTFDSSRASELMGYGKPDAVKRDMVAVDTLQKAGKSLEEVPEHVTNALTRDYSGLMKAIDKKRGA